MNQMMQQSQSQTQTTTDRNVITEKELSYVKDFMSWELLAMKKCKDTANHCTDPQIKALINQTGQKHLDHYNTLLSMLQ
ncbi:hypothetical protein [Paenibacillus roseipurpureus]|uniref:Spore coat protein n=1 Tax=Paenibacillus roseopurpureus TaxID=2918901 RepID=A0AA96RIW5_9BACL|nr:hypothetical protein [Paenibacillus sp. MBLB1832]WNR42679.1 hypothetical protein MJB10_16315 [Paenibacillus sp. MBLB1832]